MKLKDFDFRIADKEKARDYIYYFDPKKFMEKMLIDTSLYETLELELWSGVCDKRGFRIYEGDILAHDNGYGIEYHSKVVFENGVFKIAIIEHPAVEIIECLDTGFVSVVGNIHEKRELLNH